MVMIFAGGHISGGHYNPAVSMAVFVRGKLPASDLIVYWIVQIVAGVVAALLASSLLGIAAANPIPFDMTKVVIAEFLFTFALTFVVLNVATAKGAQSGKRSKARRCWRACSWAIWLIRNAGLPKSTPSSTSSPGQRCSLHVPLPRTRPLALSKAQPTTPHPILQLT